MKLLDTQFSIPYNFSLEELNSYPSLTHVYGNEQPTSDDLFWMSYYIAGDGWGTISFLRQIEKRYPNFSKQVVEYLQTLFPSIPFVTERVNLIKTRGNVKPHRDEVRNCCINIGLINSSTARTILSTDDDELTLATNREEVIAQDGCAYLLNTSRLHAVESIQDADRILISYGFLASYEAILSQYNPK